MTQRKYTARTPQQWQDHFLRQAESGLSISAYCQQQGLAVSNFYSWRKKLLDTESHSANKAQSNDESWLALTPSSAATCSTPTVNRCSDITLSLPGGIQLTIHSR